MWIYIHVYILVLLQAGYLIIPGIVAIVTRRVVSVVCLTSKICTVPGQSR